MCKAPNKYLHILACCIALCCCSLSAAAQDSLSTDSVTSEDATSTPAEGDSVPPLYPVVYNHASPTDGQWQQLTSDKAYGYRDKQEFSPKDEDVIEDDGLRRFIIAIANFLQSPIGKGMLWAALILVVGYIICWVVKGQGRGLFGEKDRVAYDAGPLSEQGLLDADWESRMKEALQAGDGRAAIRYGYLRLLQLLQERGDIAYRPDKTNMDYYRELADKPQRQSFRGMARQYEWAWYGNFVPEKEAMDSYLASFQELKSSLGNI